MQFLQHKKTMLLLYKDTRGINAVFLTRISCILLRVINFKLLICRERNKTVHNSARTKQLTGPTRQATSQKT
jgi:hypothetical protein